VFDDSRSFITRAFLRAEFDLDYRAYTAESDAELLQRLRDWDGRLRLSETQAEGAFTQTFFVDTWGYGEAGRGSPNQHTIIAKLPIPGEGAGGGAGEADLALGWFRGRRDAVPQVLCEFKDIRSKLDAKQSRKGSTRSPVEQCLNYVRGARRGLFGNEPVQPWWGLVTDMNEFRIYWWDRAPAEYIRFVIRRPVAPFVPSAKSAVAPIDLSASDATSIQWTLSPQNGDPPLCRPSVPRTRRRRWPCVAWRTGWVIASASTDRTCREGPTSSSRPGGRSCSCMGASGTSIPTVGARGYPRLNRATGARSWPATSNGIRPA
jgi:hypothetical protein